MGEAAKGPVVTGSRGPVPLAGPALELGVGRHRGRANAGVLVLGAGPGGPGSSLGVGRPPEGGRAEVKRPGSAGLDRTARLRLVSGPGIQVVVVGKTRSSKMAYTISQVTSPKATTVFVKFALFSL